MASNDLMKPSPPYEVNPRSGELSAPTSPLPRSTNQENSTAAFSRANTTTPTNAPVSTLPEPLTTAQVFYPVQQNLVPQPVGAVPTYRTAVPLHCIGRVPAPADCPVCGQRSLTRTNHHVGNTNHVWAAGLFLTTIVFLWVPYALRNLKNVDHRCGNCGAHLATWHRSGSTDVHQHF